MISLRTVATSLAATTMLIAGGTLAGCAAVNQPESMENVDVESPDEVEREHAIHVPETDGPHDVILAFHGYGGDPEQFSSIEMHVADAIVVYPEGKENAWAGAPYSVTSMDEDVAYVQSILDHLKAEYDIKDIYGVGYSNGGGFVHALDCQMPGVFKATATVAPAFYDGMLEPCDGVEKQAPRLNLQGKDDEVMEPTGGKRHGETYRDSTFVTQEIADKGIPAETRMYDGGHDWAGSPELGLTAMILEYFNIPMKPENQAIADAAQEEEA